MSLRLRLALMTLVLGLPIAGIQAWIVTSLHERDMLEVLSGTTLAYMQSIGRTECEASPATWTGGRHPQVLHFSLREGLPPMPPPDSMPGMGAPPGPWPGEPEMHHVVVQPADMYAYDVDGKSLNPQAPALDAGEVRDALAGKAVSRHTTDQGRSTLETLTSMPWSSGPCALVLTRRHGPPAELPLPWRPLLAACLTVLLSVLLAAGPMVRRIRQLTEQVRRSSASSYASEISVRGRDEVGDLARAFTHAGEEIRKHVEEQQAREKTLRNFLENTTHDVMIPLTVLQGHLANIRDELQKSQPIDPSVVSSAMSEAHYLGALMNNLAIAAKLEGAEPALQKGSVDLNALVARVVGRHSPLAKEKHVALEWAVPKETVLTLADVTLAEQAISNIVFNAVRYNHREGHVAVILEQRGARFVVQVIDDGPGIPPEEMSRLVERHFRGNEARTREPNGHGLGLAIAWKATRMHGWELRLQPSEFKGLQVEIEGPVAAD